MWGAARSLLAGTRQALREEKDRKIGQRTAEAVGALQPWGALGFPLGMKWEPRQVFFYLLFCFYRITGINNNVFWSEIDKSSQHKIWKARGNLIYHVNKLTSSESRFSCICFSNTQKTVINIVHVLNHK